MYNDLFSIGPFTVHGYGLMTAIGIISAYFYCERTSKKKGINPDSILGLVLFCIIFGYLGSKLLYFITILPQIIEDPSVILRSITDGWVIYGGILGGIFGGWLYCKIRKYPTLKYFDMGLPAVALAQGFGRIGCFLAGCCYGKETTSTFSIVFTNSDFAPNGVQLIPTQLIMSACDFALFIFLVLLDRKSKRDGLVLGAYLLFYSAGRFIIEFFRGDVARGSVGVLSTSQFIAIFMMAAGLIAWIWIGKQKPVEETAQTAAEAENAAENEEPGNAYESTEEAEESSVAPEAAENAQTGNEESAESNDAEE